MVQMINGCGKQVSHGMVCGDSIDTGDYDYITGREYCQPVLYALCEKKTDIFKYQMNFHPKSKDLNTIIN